MVFTRDVLEKKAKAHERFARRFSAIVEKHDKNLYGGEYQWQTSTSLKNGFASRARTLTCPFGYPV